MDVIIMATHNLHKVDEAKSILSNHNILTLSDINYHLEIPETGETLFENALIKVKAIFEATGKACMADDTGLEVNALYGAPGVYSARYAGSDASSGENINKILSELSGVYDRAACFRTVIAYMNDYGQYRFFEGSVKGEITEEPRGNFGFGYDPIFRPAGYAQTFAEMSASQKNRISHRKLALNEFQRFFDLLESA